MDYKKIKKIARLLTFITIFPMKKVFFSLAAASLFTFASCSSSIDCECSLDSDLIDFSIEFETEEDDCFEGLLENIETEAGITADDLRNGYNCSEL